MYDKGNNLRIEVTINNPREFKVLKDIVVIKEHEKLETEKVWKPMAKSITNIYRYGEISKSIINRFIEALPQIDIDTLHINESNKISIKIEKNDRVYSGINILSDETLNIFKVIGNGKYIINGFTNKSIRSELFKDFDSNYIKNKTTRLLAKLKAHGLIKKVAKKNKYYLTVNGRKIIDTILLFTQKELLS